MQCVDCGWIMDMDKNTETLKQTTEKHGNQNIYTNKIKANKEEKNKP